MNAHRDPKWESRSDVSGWKQPHRDPGWPIKPQFSNEIDEPKYILSIGTNTYRCGDMDEVHKIYRQKGDGIKGYVYDLSTTIEIQVATTPIVNARLTTDGS